MTQNNEITDKRRIAEISAVLATGIGKFIFMDYLDWKLPFIITSIVAWTVYVLWQSSNNKIILNHWGYRFDNFMQSLKLVLPFGIIAVISFIVIGIIQNTINPSWHLIPILIIYPLWGVIQQFLVIALVAGNLQDIESITIRKPVTILITAVFFGIIHYPYGWLMIGTFILALFYGYTYLKIRNIYVLGLFHGWLGGLFFYTVVNRDPFIEVFGKFIN
ncbi:CPBP family intramembrane glutamic endopeptidase [Plebeiibacterium sediminum]|uniref:CPBP family intramembrane metalloprotease n=1 Tax=Plebeiibacterium sediminum TaxID=2992112 RepID=A0AAE3SI81_9BACT|nr:CPBP family intramembrane glutamic endopeptidase [Plebeiobacterium sediminum]MCW3788913.1 CPBP family intramembrane metalloprotease [Plebeiobacterium sediminum]